jgi:hypothetical protein
MEVPMSVPPREQSDRLGQVIVGVVLVALAVAVAVLLL